METQKKNSIFDLFKNLFSESLLESKYLYLNENEQLIKVNSLLELNYTKFNDILCLGGKYNFLNIKKAFKEQIFKATNDQEQIKINLAFEYFISDPNKITSYDPSDKEKLKKFSEFNPTMLIIINDFDSFKIYLKSNQMNLNSSFDESSRSFLYLACKCGYKKFVIFLLKYGADPEKKQLNGSTPLHVACYYRHKDIVELILQVGSSYKIKNKFNNLPEDESTEEIKQIIGKYKSDCGYKFFLDNRSYFKNIKLLFDNYILCGKRCSINETNKDWDLAWHGTMLKYIPSIIKYGLKKCGEKAGDIEIDIRNDTNRIGRDNKFREKNDWAGAVFTSNSLFYATARAYAEHFKDKNGVEWIVVLECRIKPHTYFKSSHTFNEYSLRNGEDENVENRSENSNDVSVCALWYFTKEYLRKSEDYKILLNKIKKYIS